jgi:hypothetical protein
MTRYAEAVRRAIALALAACHSDLDRVDARVLRSEIESAREALDGSLELAIARSLRQGHARESLLVLRELLTLDGAAFAAAFADTFELRESPPALFTAYYALELDARRAPDDVFRYPLYALAPEPWPTRHEVEEQGVLAG